MSAVLLIWAGVAFFFAATFFIGARSAIHEIEAGLVPLIGTVAIVGVAIL